MFEVMGNRAKNRENGATFGPVGKVDFGSTQKHALCLTQCWTKPSSSPFPDGVRLSRSVIVNLGVEQSNTPAFIPAPLHGSQFQATSKHSLHFTWCIQAFMPCFGGGDLGWPANVRCRAVGPRTVVDHRKDTAQPQCYLMNYHHINNDELWFWTSGKLNRDGYGIKTKVSETQFPKRKRANLSFSQRQIRLPKPR